MTFEIPNPKLQIPNKFQCPISNVQIYLFGIWVIGDWNLFDAWCLGFGA
jgi:hypothetical protein